MRKSLIGGGVALAMALAPAAVLAQDDMAEDMDDGDMMMGSMVPHPSHIHAGDCSMPGDVIAPLSDVGVVGNDAEGAAAHIHVDIGQSTVPLALDAILAADHSIMVHQSADDLTVLSCGAIGGHDVGDAFLIGMGPVDGSGYAGIAWLTDNGDGSTDVQVTITQTGAEGMHDDMDDMSMDDDMSDDMSDDDMDDDDMDDDDMDDDSMDDDE